MKKKRRRKIHRRFVLLSIVLVWTTGFFIQIVNKQAIEAKSEQLSSQILFEQENESTTIVLDAGHGAIDSGSISRTGVYEKDITLSLTLKIQSYLEKQGISTVLTRDSDAIPFVSEKADLARRVAIGLENDGDYFISIHLNFSNYNDGAKGFEIYTDFQEEHSYEMAATILQEMAELDYTINRGLKSTDETPLYVVDQNPIPSLLIECGFISDEEDFRKLNDESFQDQLAYQISKGILETLQEG